MTYLAYSIDIFLNTLLQRLQNPDANAVQSGSLKPSKVCSNVEPQELIQLSPLSLS